jgi:catechol 2,3-dioxygenase-like lactoylglutathione lyase family enzyme
MPECNYLSPLLKIPVTDVERSSQFYAEQLGFELQFSAAEYGWAQLIDGELCLALYQPGMGGGSAQIGGSTGFHLSLPAEAFQAQSQRLLEAGHLMDDRVHSGDDGSTFMDVRDPDGNVVKIMQRS